MTGWTLVTQGTLGPLHPKNSSNCCRSTQGLVKAGTAKKFFKQVLADAQSTETVLAKKISSTIWRQTYNISEPKGGIDLIAVGPRWANYLTNQIGKL
jgi:hypothetical protein